MRLSVLFGMVCLVGFFGARAAWADGVVLTNGDVLHGEVVSLDTEKLTLSSKTLGEIALPRPKVASVHFGDVRLDKQQPSAPLANPQAAAGEGTPAAGLQAPATPEDLIGQLTGKKVAPPAGGGSAEDALRQLQSGGLNPQALAEVQKALPLLSTPEVREYFDSTVGGLMGGQLSIGDVRKDAIKARDMIHDLQKDLGPGAAALNGYLSILEGFIDGTEPAEGAATEDAAAEDSAAPGAAK